VYAESGHVHREAATEEQARADRAADRHHRLLAGGELPRQDLLVADARVDGAAGHHAPGV
jgi:hypothetical protein